jgi:hypothetical protein
VDAAVVRTTTMDGSSMRRPQFAEFELGVLCHVAGSLLAWGLGLLAYMMFQLWQDYISLILCAFLLSQSLHTPCTALVKLARRLRTPNGQTLLHRLRGMATSRDNLRAKLGSVPPLITLALVLFLDIVDDIAPRVTIVTAILAAVLVVVVLTWVFDRRLLAYHHVVSDEVVAATLVLATLLVLVTFVTTVILVNSVLDGVGLVVEFSGWASDVAASGVAPSAVTTFGELAVSMRHLGMVSLSKLSGPDTKWAEVASHVLEGLGDDTNGTALVESTFAKMRRLYPGSGWLLQSEDLGKLVIWASGSGAGSGGSHGRGSGADPSFWDISDIAWQRLQTIENPAELIHRIYEAADPVAKVQALSGQAATWIGTLLVLVLRLLNFLLTFGVSSIMLATMTFYMLCMKQDSEDSEYSKYCKNSRYSRFSRLQ